MCKKFISAILLIVFSSVLANASGVTNIKEIVNNTSIVLTVTKIERNIGSVSSLDFTQEIPANGGVWTGDMWIPWVNNEQDSRDRWSGIQASTGGDSNRTIQFYLFHLANR